MANVRIKDLPEFTPNKGSWAVSDIETSPGVFTTSKTRLSAFAANAGLNNRVWQSTSTTVSSLSTEWTGTYFTTRTLSGTWSEAYTLLTAKSAYWDTYTGKVQSGEVKWNIAYNQGTSVFSTVCSNSAEWGGGYSAYTTVQEYSAGWGAGNATAVYNNVNTLSAQWTNASSAFITNSGAGINAFTSLRSASGNYNIVAAYVRGSSATSNIDFNDTRFVNATGDIINGELTITGGVTARGATVNASLSTSELTAFNATIQNDLFATDVITSNIKPANGMMTTVYGNLSSTNIIYGNLASVFGANGLVENVQNSGTNKANFFIMNDGGVWGTGNNTSGQLGTGSTASNYVLPHRCGFTPPLRLNERVVKVYGNGETTFALTNSGTVYGTGKNDTYQLGLGDTTNRAVFTKNPTLENQFIEQLAVGTGNDATNLTVLARTRNGQVWGWGNNSKGQLGCFLPGVTTTAHLAVTARPVYLSTLSAYEPVTDIVLGGNAGNFTSYINTLTAGVFVAGDNQVGQLGTTTIGLPPFSARFASLSAILGSVGDVPVPVTKISVGGDSGATTTTWFVMSGGGLSACGHNNTTDGRLGSITRSSLTTFASATPVEALRRVWAPSKTNTLFSGTLTQGSNVITGINAGDIANLSVGLAVSAVYTVGAVTQSWDVGATITAIDPSLGTATLNVAYIPGANNRTGQILMKGGFVGTTNRKVVDVIPHADTTANATVLVLTDNPAASNVNYELWGWGFNTNGQLASGTNVTTTTAVYIANNIKSAVIGGFQDSSTVLALNNVNHLSSWGFNTNGNCGVGTASASYSRPQRVLINEDAGTILQFRITNNDIAATGYTCLALMDSGKVLAWGSNNDVGQTGTDPVLKTEFIPTWVKF